MSVLGDKKIVIRLPRFDWKVLLTARAAAVLAIGACLAGLAFWWVQVRPYLWVSGAHVEAVTAAVASDAQGRIVEARPQEGDRVEKGSALFALANESLALRQRQAQAEIERLEEKLRLEKGRMEKAMSDYLVVSGDLASAGAEEWIAAHLQALEEAQGEAEKAAEQLAAAQEELVRLGQEAEKTRFAAPFDGVVLKKNKQAGDLLSFGEPVYLLADPARIWVEAEIPEENLSEVAVGVPVRVQVAAYPKKEWTGRISWVGPATVSSCGSRPRLQGGETIPIRINLDSPDLSLKPGLSAKVGLKVR